MFIPFSTQNTEAGATNPKKVKKYKKYSKAWWRAYNKRARQRKSLNARKRTLRLRQIRLAKSAKASKQVPDSMPPRVTETVTQISAQPVAEIAPDIRVNDLFILLQGRISQVFDGDSFEIETKTGKAYTVRMLGVDAPGVGDDLGGKSQKNLSELILGKDATVIIRKKDAAERFIGTVYYGGEDINLKQIESGMARYLRQAGYEPKGDDRQIYERAEENARAQQKGLWARQKSGIALRINK